MSGILSEDQNFVDKSESGELASFSDVQNAEDLNRILDEEFKEFADYRKQFEEAWEEEQAFYDGDHWKVAKNRPVKNFVFSIIESEVPILTDSRPSSDCVPYEEGSGDQSDEQKAKILSECSKWVDNNQNFEIKLAQEMRQCLITGTAWQYIDFDPDLDNGEGNITIESLHWRQVFCDPSSGDLDKGRAVHILFPMRVEELQRKFPDQEIPKVSFDQVLFGVMSADGMSTEHWNPTRNSSGSVSKYAGEGFTVLHECQRKDYSTVPIEEEETTLEIAEETKQLLAGENPDVHKYENHSAHMDSHERLKQQILEERFGIVPGSIPDEQYNELMKDPTAILEMVPPQTAMNPAMLEGGNPQMPPAPPMPFDPNIVEEVALLFHIIDDHIESHLELQKINPKGERPKYKNNMRLIMRVGHQVLYDGDMPVDDGIFSLVPYYCYKSSDCIYGTGEIKNIMSSQKSFNEMDYSEYKGLKLNANSGWVKDDTSNVKNDTLSNSEGIVITKKQGTMCERLPPGEVSPQLQQRMFRDLQAMEQISGVQEATQGKRPAGITAAAAIRELREQSIGRIRLKTRMMESYSILRLGRLKASRIVKFWSTERKLRLWDDYGKIKYIIFNPSEFRDFRFDVMIVPGSTAGIDKETIYTIYMGIFEKGGIDARTFFEVTDLPYKNKVLERLDQMDQQKMLVQQLAGENQQLKAILMKIHEEKNGKNINSSSENPTDQLTMEAGTP